MATCEVCGNDHCGVRIIGHGHQAGGQRFCCANCARHSGVEGVADRAD
jgi:hypothetical protein